jgi:hypothetical protein
MLDAISSERLDGLPQNPHISAAQAEIVMVTAAIAMSLIIMVPLQG